MCRAEAPGVEQFARDNADTVRVVGLGAHDSPEEAVEFVESTGTYSFPMLWDEGFESWSTFGVTGQPAAILAAPNGTIINGWLGAFNLDEVLDAINAE